MLHLLTITLACDTHGSESRPSGARKHLRVEPRDMADHVAQRIPIQITNPAGSDCSMANIAVLSMLTHDRSMSTYGKASMCIGVT